MAFNQIRILYQQLLINGSMSKLAAATVTNGRQPSTSPSTTPIEPIPRVIRAAFMFINPCHHTPAGNATSRNNLNSVYRNLLRLRPFWPAERPSLDFMKSLPRDVRHTIGKFPLTFDEAESSVKNNMLQYDSKFDVRCLCAGCNYDCCGWCAELRPSCLAFVCKTCGCAPLEQGVESKDDYLDRCTTPCTYVRLCQRCVEDRIDARGFLKRPRVFRYRGQYSCCDEMHESGNITYCPGCDVGACGMCVNRELELFCSVCACHDCCTTEPDAETLEIVYGGGAYKCACKSCATDNCQMVRMCGDCARDLRALLKERDSGGVTAKMSAATLEDSPMDTMDTNGKDVET